VGGDSKLVLLKVYKIRRGEGLVIAWVDCFSSSSSFFFFFLPFFFLFVFVCVCVFIIGGFFFRLRFGCMRFFSLIFIGCVFCVWRNSGLEVER